MTAEVYELRESFTVQANFQRLKEKNWEVNKKVEKIK